LDSTNQNDELPECPECDKAIAVKEDSQKIGEFLEWLQLEKQMPLCKYGCDDTCSSILDMTGNIDCDCNKTTLIRAHTGIEELLAEYFDVDLQKVEREKRRLLAKVKVLNQ
jgi:hypothetical protein